MNNLNSFQVGSKMIHFEVEGKRRKLFIDKNEYNHIKDILEALPDLKSENIILAKVIDFFYQGFENDLISHPDEFKKMYENLIEKEKNIPSFLDVPRSSNWGIYNLSEVTTPYWEGNKFHFYVWNYALLIPYRVTYNLDIEECEYETLELAL